MGSSAYKQENELHKLEVELESLRRDNAQLSQRYVEAQSSLVSVTQSVRWRLVQAVFRLFHYIIPEKSALREKIKKFSRVCYRSLQSAFKPNSSNNSMVAASRESETEKFVPPYELALDSSPACLEFVQISPNASELFPLDLADGMKLEWKLQHQGGKLRGVSVQLGTHGRTNSGLLVMELLDSDSRKILRSVKIEADRVLDNQFQVFAFEPLDLESYTDQKSSHLFLRLHSEGAHQGSTLAIWVGAKPISEKSNDYFLYPRRYQFFPWYNDKVKSGAIFVPRYEAASASGLRYGFKGAVAHAHNLTTETACRLKIPVIEEKIKSVSLVFGTHGRINHCQLRVELGWIERGKYIALDSKLLACAELHDNIPMQFKFPEYPESAQELYLALESPDADENNFIAVWGGVCRPFDRQKAKYDHPLRAKFLSSVPAGIETVDTIYPAKLSDKSSQNRILLIYSEQNLSGLSECFNEMSKALDAAADRIDCCSISELHLMQDKLQVWELIVLQRQLMDGDQIREFIHQAKQKNIPVLSVLDLEHDLEALCVVTEAASQRAEKSCARPRLLREALQLSVEASDIVVGASAKLSELCAQLGVPIEASIGTAAQKLLDPTLRQSTQKLPTVQLVTVLYKKGRELPFTLECYRQQTYAGPIELTFVDDCCPENSAALIESSLEDWKSKSTPARKLKILRNQRNSGNCASRNFAIANSSSEIVIVIDADCVINPEFIAEHVRAHAASDCDVVIGPFNLETGSKDPLRVISEYNANRDIAEHEAELQDKINRHSFLNCITRNFSIKRSFLSRLNAELFDELFGYSADPESGFGWEDIEMGYRLYRAGARIKYIDSAISVHVSHPATTSEQSKAARSQLNFRRMLEKHPELALVARRWVLDTYQRIKRWCDESACGDNEDRRYLEQRLSSSVPVLKLEPKVQDLKILSFRWHCPHQYELYKLGARFDLVSDAGTDMCRGWNIEERPMPDNARFISMQKALASKYDLAILHFDENVLNAEQTNAVHSEEWGKSFRWLRENAKSPIIAVCHGTPQFKGQFDAHYAAWDLGEVIEENRKRLVDYLADSLVICNSYQAQREWGFKRSSVIWQGFDPTEFPSSTYQRGVLALGSSMRERPVYRGYFFYQQILQHLPKQYHPQHLEVPKPGIYYSRMQKNYAQAKFQNYVAALRSHSIYLNPTLRSPMPRSRGEAMMCGLVTVSAANHDVDMFIKNGYNGFYSNEPAELAEYISFLMRDKVALEKIGARSRSTAINLFNHDRYLMRWQSTIKEVLG